MIYMYMNMGKIQTNPPPPPHTQKEIIHETCLSCLQWHRQRMFCKITVIKWNEHHKLIWYTFWCLLQSDRETAYSLKIYITVSNTLSYKSFTSISTAYNLMIILKLSLMHQLGLYGCVTLIGLLVYWKQRLFRVWTISFVVCWWINLIMHLSQTFIHKASTGFSSLKKITSMMGIQ